MYQERMRIMIYCHGCHELHEDEDVRRYRGTDHVGESWRALYCATCAGLARADWNGNTATIEDDAFAPTHRVTWWAGPHRGPLVIEVEVLEEDGAEYGFDHGKGFVVSRHD